MCWYWWKLWRFAWSVGRGRAGKQYMSDGHGEWTCVYGHLYFLTKPTRRNP